MANYYVNSAAADDTGVGSEADPWKFFQTHVGTPAAGDTVYFRGGATAGTRRDYTEINSITAANANNGTALAPITIRNYPGEFVRFLPSGNNRAWSINGRDYWVIDGEDSDYHIKIDMQDHGTAGEGVILTLADNCTLRYLEITNGSFDQLVRLDGTDGCVVEYCKIYDNFNGVDQDGHGIYVIGTSGASGTTTIRNNTIFDCYGDGVQVGSTTDQDIGTVYIHDNDIYAQAAAAAGCENAVDIKDGTAHIYNNTLHGFRKCDGTSGGTSAHGEAIYLHNFCVAAYVYGNVIYDISGPALYVLLGATPTVEFYRNLVYDLVYELANDNGWLNVLYCASASVVKAYNNTIYGKYGAGENLIRLLSTANLTIRNNIFSGTGTLSLSTGTLTADHNCWFESEASQAGAGDVITDPELTNPAADDYTIGAGSPCYEAGTTTGAPAGLTYLGTAPDIGYYEVTPTPSSVKGGLQTLWVG